MKVFCSWSGGKDSCFSCYKAMLQGHEVAHLFTMFTTTGRYTRSHRLSRKLLLAQTGAIGIPLYPRHASWNAYEREFKRALAFFKRQDVNGGVFGDLYLNEHRDWVEKICGESGVMPFLPLWGMDGKELLRRFVEAGFEALVIAVRADILGDHWLGKKIDEEFLEQMEKAGVDVCGENGEYHTLVIDGPIFKKRITIRKTKAARRKNMFFLQVLSFELEEKDI